MAFVDRVGSQVLPVLDHPIVERRRRALGARQRQRSERETEPPIGFPGAAAAVAVDAGAQPAVLLKGDGVIRRVPGFQEASFFEKAKRYFDIQSFAVSPVEMAADYKKFKNMLLDMGEERTAFAFFYHGSHKGFLLAVKPDVRDEMGEDLYDSLKKLDVVVLSRLIFRKCLGFTEEGLDDDEIFHYQSDTCQALSSVASGEYQMMFMLNATRIEHVTEVAENGLVMPRKSTYFYPKVLTGLVFNKIDPKEIISVP